MDVQSAQLSPESPPLSSTAVDADQDFPRGAAFWRVHHCSPNTDTFFQPAAGATPP
jgi:hypothetical protein